MAVCWPRLGGYGPASVLFCPVECVVGDFFPAVLTKGVVGAAGEGLELGDGCRVLVVLEASTTCCATPTASRSPSA
jgi:hypothetical protein